MVDKTHYSYWETTVNELYSMIKPIVNAYMKEGITLTNRQLYYRLVGKNLIPNRDEVYKRICKFLTDLKYAGYIDWDAFEDRSRVPERKSQWDSVQDLIDSATKQYRLPRWQDQHYYIEVYCEKDAMDSVLRPITDKYHVYFGTNKGYTSSSTIYEIAQRVDEQLEEEKKVVLLYLGDHDPSGLDMVRDVEERITEMLMAWRYGLEPIDDYPRYLTREWIEDNFHVQHIALTYDQVEYHEPPPNPAKLDDPRSKKYVKQYGKISWELDAIEPKILIKLTEDAILEYIDIDKYNAWIEQEKEESKALIQFGEEMREDDLYKLTEKAKELGITTVGEIRSFHCGRVNGQCDCCDQINDDGKTCSLKKKRFEITIGKEVK